MLERIPDVPGGNRVLDGTLSPQLVLRLGWPPVGPPLPVTPRRTYQEEER